MVNTILALSGEVGAGKTTLAKRLVARYGAHHISTHVLLSRRLGSQAIEERGALQEAGQRLDRQTKGAWIVDEMAPELDLLPPDTLIVVDAIRMKGQLDALRHRYGRRVTHLHLEAPLPELVKRYAGRVRHSKFREFKSYSKVRENRTERNVRNLSDDADVVIDTASCTEADVEVRTAAHLGLSGRTGSPSVDVVVGGQYGSEGKGNVAFYLARDYDLLVRVGGPNAGHMVPRHNGVPFTHRLLPSGTQNSRASLLIAPGAVVDVEILLREIADSGVGAERLWIDPHVMIISAADRNSERQLVRAIGSTGKGVGAATARRIRGRSGYVTLARDVPRLKPYLRAASEVLQDAFGSKKRVLVEGTQGTMLSLYHGDYPHVTSRDTTVSGCLAEAGIPPSRVRRVVMVCRTYPIRVQSPRGSTSGPMRQEMTWEALAERSGIALTELLSAERGSVSKKQRRVAEFDWAMLQRASQLNGPTDIALTFVDYLSVKNRKARRLDQLTEETIRFVEEVERVSGATVSLMSTRFHPRSIIDRRHW